MKVISMFIVFIHYVFQESSSVRVCTQMNVSVHGEIADFLRGGDDVLCSTMETSAEEC